ncbi:NAD(P)H-dependent flavin oxidoreductase [Agromyces italicus]|uniref:NAD(P)H-dependent flavin oxidoreductase n=1 Tax=Agromyces italicus TaxID=279572 RepID=UPI0003B69985|nr:nitronate monooxygenase [Agromyces italicus]
MSAVLSTPWSASLGLATPIVSAPMGGVAGGRFASAVSRAGALGMIGMGSAGSAAKLAAQLAEFERDRARHGRVGEPCGVGLVHWGIERDPALLDVAIGAGPSLISVSFAERFEWVDRVHAAGSLAATQVATAAEALTAADAGVDVIVARGSDGGGHGDPRIGTLALLDAVLDVIDARAPVLAAGGIGSGRSLAAVLAAGAAGAWIGTALSASTETLTPPAAIEVLLAATGDDTVTTCALDAALGLPWPERFPERVIRNDLVDTWQGRVEELRTATAASDGTDLVALRAAIFAANRDGDHALVPVDAGQGVGLLRESRPVAEVLDEFTRAAAALLGRPPGA